MEVDASKQKVEYLQNTQPLAMPEEPQGAANAQLVYIHEEILISGMLHHLHQASQTLSANRKAYGR